MIVFETEIVINNKFGGFSLNEEMANWLAKERKWKILDKYVYEQKDSYDVKTLYHSYGSYNSAKGMYDVDFRSHKDLVDCVRHFKKVHEYDSYPDNHYGLIHSLEIQKVKVMLAVDDYFDGKERIRNDVYIEENENE